jgi:metal-responsive CopG/Arc/MetJ family transcriptional regulator
VPTVRKVTVSLPDQLAAHIEQLRKRVNRSRSQVVADLLWRGGYEAEQEQREARYRAAYTGTPDEREDDALIDAASGDFFADADPWPEAAARTPSPDAQR